MSETQSNNLPPLPVGEEISNFLPQDHWQEVDVEQYRLDFTKPYEKPDYLLTWNDVGFAPLGGVQAITGQSGNGKTMTIAQMIAAVLNGDFGSLHYNLGDMIPEPVVLYIDTEMEESNTIAMKNRVLSMTGRRVGDEYDDFIIIMLREATSDEERVSAATMRWRLTLKALQTYRPTVCFIDGLLDVVNDFNSNTECQELIYKCMQAATYYRCSLWCLVHQNPGAEKLVGHLGSMLERKVTDIFETKKDKNPTTGAATFTVHQKKARGRDVPDWKFQVDASKAAWGVPVQLTSEPLDNDDVEQIRQWLTDGQFDIEWPATLTEIRNLLKQRGGQKNNSRVQADVTVAKNRRFIIPQSESEWTNGQKKPKYYLNSQEIEIRKQDETCPF